MVARVERRGVVAAVLDKLVRGWQRLARFQLWRYDFAIRSTALLGLRYHLRSEDMPTVAGFLELATSIVTIVGLPVAIWAIVQNTRAARKSALISEGEFFLNLENMLVRHDPIYINLRGSGAWTQTGTGPETAEDWARLSDYMGFFEHCEHLLQQGSISEPVYRKLFGNRVRHIMANDRVVKTMLVDRASGWSLFIRHAERLGFAVEPPPELPDGSPQG